jgi:3-hydroxy acid dehydrogenase / malonic semialdehyde reductase
MATEQKIALVTGASSGFGMAIAERLASRGLSLILLARRKDRLEALADRLNAPAHVVACDVRDSASLREAVDELPDRFRKVDILINNAGLALGLEPAHQTHWEDWEQMIATNCTALAYLTRLILPGMVARGTGHVIMIGSVAGAYAYPGGNVYGATKAFVDQLAKNLRADLAGTGVRVTNIAPGLAGGSEFSQVRFHGDVEKAANVYAGTSPLQPADIAECVDWTLQQPAHVNINSIELMPTSQASGPLAVHRSED